MVYWSDELYMSSIAICKVEACKNDVITIFIKFIDKQYMFLL